MRVDKYFSPTYLVTDAYVAADEFKPPQGVIKPMVDVVNSPLNIIDVCKLRFLRDHKFLAILRLKLGRRFKREGNCYLPLSFRIIDLASPS